MRTILLIDDNDLVRDAVRGMLEARGFSVVTADDGETAITRYAESPIDAVLVDMDLPGANGLETCRRLRAISADSRRSFCAWVIAGVVCADLEPAARAAGAQGILPKPFSLSELVGCLQAKPATTEHCSAA